MTKTPTMHPCEKCVSHKLMCDEASAIHEHVDSFIFLESTNLGISTQFLNVVLFCHIS